MTLHRPALVDGPLLADAIAQLARGRATSCRSCSPPIRAPGPRSNALGDRRRGAPGIRLLDPIGYLEFLGLVDGAAGVLTDSGGIQEETTFLGIPCFTLRDNTERPVTVEQRHEHAARARAGADRRGPGAAAVASERPASVPLWDGEARSADRGVLAEAELPERRLPSRRS